MLMNTALEFNALACKHTRASLVFCNGPNALMSLNQKGKNKCLDISLEQSAETID